MEDMNVMNNTEMNNVNGFATQSYLDGKSFAFGVGLGTGLTIVIPKAVKLIGKLVNKITKKNVEKQEEDVESEMLEAVEVE